MAGPDGYSPELDTGTKIKTEPINFDVIHAAHESSILESDRLKQEWGDEKGHALFALKTAGLIDIGEEILDSQSRRSIIFQVDKFKSDSIGFNELKSKLGPLAKMRVKRNIDNKSIAQYKPIAMAMLDIFEDVTGYSQEDYDKKKNDPFNPENEAKPLFIIPETSELSPEIVANTPGYIGLWEVVNYNNRNTTYPTQEEGFVTRPGYSKPVT